jgi:hypothetical protein
MALLGTASNGQSSALGSWCEVTLSGAAAITANAETSHTVTLPAGSNILSTLPITATCLLSGSTAIQGGTNAWGVGIGLRTASLSGSTLTLTLAADAAAAANIPSGSRIIISNINGI